MTRIYTMSEAARLLDVHENTIRYAEREGRVRRTPRDEFGARIFTAEDLAYLGMILRPQPKRRRQAPTPGRRSTRSSSAT